MSASSATRRAIAEIDFGDGANVSFKVGNRSIHQFWHLFSSHFRHVLLAPQRRADSGKVAWTWREAGEKRPVTATELVEVRRRLSEANRSLVGGFGGIGPRDDDDASSLEGQVRASVGEMVGQLLAQRDSALAGFVCRTDAGLMLHSWGAAVAAQPFFPDAQHAEISGTVFVGIERPAGVSVVLENMQGIGGARVKSDKEGVFLFPNVAPGSYHVRVADRSDFPGGLTVEIERESITGLELRSASAEPLSMAGNITPMEEEVPSFRRRWAGLVSLVLILVAGIVAWWWSKRSSDARGVAQNQSSSWQSAKGQLATNNLQTPKTDDHKVGDDGAFSSLSSSVPPSKLRITRASSAPRAGGGLREERSTLQPGDSESSLRPDAEEKNSSADIGKKSTDDHALPVGHLSSGPREKLSDNSTEKKGSSETADAAPSNDEDLKAAKNKSAKFSGSGAGKKPASVASATLSSADARPQSDALPSVAADAGSNPTNPSIPPPGGGNVRKVAAAQSSVPAGVPAASPASDANPEGEDSDSAGAPAAAVSPDQSISNQGKKTNASAKGAVGNKFSSAPSSSAVPAIASDLANESTDAGPSAEKSPGSAVQTKGTAGKDTPSQPSADESPALEDNEASTAKTAAGATATQASKRNAGDTRKPASAPKAATDTTASASDDSSETSPAAKSAASAERKSPAQRGRSAKNGMAAASSEDEEDEPVTEGSISPMAPAPGKPIRPIEPAVNESDGLRSIGTIRISPWKSRLVQDLILPTRPLPADEEETVEVVREKALRERIAQKPGSFQQPVARSGLAFEFGVDGAEKSGSPHWENDRDAEVTGLSATGHRAELEWGVAGPMPNTNYTLGYSDGRVIALVSVDESGVPALKTAAGVRVWCWFGVERKAADSSPARKESGAEFEWRLLPEGTIPASWKTDDRWAGGQGQRVDIPLDSTTARVGGYEVALVDPASGWALARNVSVQKP